MPDAVTKSTEPAAAEAPKIEETTAAPAVDSTPAVEETTSPVPAAEEAKPADETKAAEEPKKEEEKSEPKEITHGTLAKTHRGVLSFFKQKRYFYFQEDAVSDDKLKHHYLHKESASKATAAHASQTGKGLWFYSKDESHKDAPHGIVKLADVVEVVHIGANKFVLRLSNGELQFEAPAADRNNWVYTLKQKVEEAKAFDKEVVESEGYLSALERFGKPVVGAVKPVEKVAETKPDETPAAEEKKEEEPNTEEPGAAAASVPEAGVTSEDETGATDVKRSASKKAKRGSVFEKFEKFKSKSHKVAEKEPETKAETKDETKEDETKPVDSAEASAGPLSEATEGPQAHETAETSDAANPSEQKTADEERPTLATSPKEKRKSSFFSFGKKKEEAAVPVADEKKDDAMTEDKGEASPEEAAAVAPNDDAKPSEAVNVVEPDSSKTADVPASETDDAEKSATPASPKPASKGFFSGFLAKREKSPAPKAAVEPTVETKLETPVADPKDDAPALTSETVPETAVESPAAAEEPIEAAASPKEKRKSSFFAFKKPTKSEDVKSDSEDAEPKDKAAPKTNYVQGLIRKVSQRTGSSKAPEKEVATPAPVVEETEPASEATPTVPAKEEVKEEAPTPAAAEDKASQSIGDVVPEAVNVGKPAPVTA